MVSLKDLLTITNLYTFLEKENDRLIPQVDIIETSRAENTLRVHCLLFWDLR